MKLGERKAPAVFFNPFLTLSPEDKEWVRGILADPRFAKFMSVAQKYRPGSNCPKSGSTERDAYSNERAAARLAEMRGWDLYQTAIFAILSEKATRELGAVIESFPDSGRIDANWGELPPEQ